MIEGEFEDVVGAETIGFSHGDFSLVVQALHDALCSNKTGTLTTGDMALESSFDALGAPSERPLALAWLNSRFETGIRSPLDTAILKCQPADLDGYEKRDEVPFDFERRRVSIVVDSQAPGEHRLLITKGAPEGIFSRAVSYESGGKVLAMAEDAGGLIHETYNVSSARGYRVLAVAYRRIDQRAAYSSADEHDLTLAGFLTFADPPVADAREVIEALHRDGVLVKIITGDGDLVAQHVCDQVGLDHGRVVLGEELNRTSDAALGHVVENTSVFARISPAQKTCILVALKQRGHVVGFMGDGINDAPSLRVADVGISVSTAVDVARDAAGIILMEPGLRVLHKGIIEGRKAFGNVTKYLLMGTSSNFGNMFSMAGASLFLPFLPMLPTQFVIRTMRSPWRSRPSRALAATTVAIVLVGLLLPYTPPSTTLGFTRLSALYFAFLGPATVTYLLLVETVKRCLFRSQTPEGAKPSDPDP